jgi:Flp pilus assembly protein TadD
MSGRQRIRLRQAIREAEGYLELGMPRHSLDVLGRVDDPGTFRAQVLYLTGESLRALERFEEAVQPLVSAGELTPSNTHIWLALGWCYKRTGRLEQAIGALEQAGEVDPDSALIQYNLACYWSLAGGKPQALAHLARALTMDEHFRDLIGTEADFDPIRSDPDFQAITGATV